MTAVSRQEKAEVGIKIKSTVRAFSAERKIGAKEEIMEKVKLGIIGIGNMGSVHLGNILKGKVPGLELAAVADRKESRRAQLRETLPAAIEIFEEGRELIERGSVAAVLIAVPHYQHPELSIAAFRKGLHVLCEKPAGVYTKQVREMNEAAKKSDVVFAMMFNQRTNCIYRKIHEMIENGEIGAIRRVNWIITDWYRTQIYYDSGSWRATWDGEGGGVLLNQCPHQLDLLQWLCGLPVRVQGFCHEGKWHDIEVEDDVTAVLEFANGATGVFVTSTGDAPGTNRLEITGENGKLVSEDGKLTFWRQKQSIPEHCATSQGGFDKPGMEIVKVETDGQDEEHIGVIKAFAGRILNGTPLVAEGVEGIRGLTLSNAIHLSSWLKRPVEIPFDEDLFLAELEKRRASSRAKEDRDIVFNTEGSYGK